MGLQMFSLHQTGESNLLHDWMQVLELYFHVEVFLFFKCNQIIRITCLHNQRLVYNTVNNLQ